MTTQLQAECGGAPWAPAPRRRVGLAVFCGHVLLALLLAQALERRPLAPAAAELPGRLVWLSPALTLADAHLANTRAPHKILAGDQGATRRPSASRMASEASEANPGLQAPPLPDSPLSPAISPSPVAQSPVEPAATLRLLPADPPASAPREPLLQTEATRLAIRQAGRNPLLSERAALATGIQPTTNAERLAAATGAAAKGDCLKGGFSGGGMGLLSLPFLAVAAATGQCAK